MDGCPGRGYFRIVAHRRIIVVCYRIIVVCYRIIVVCYRTIIICYKDIVVHYRAIVSYPCVMVFHHKLHSAVGADSIYCGNCFHIVNSSWHLLLAGLRFFFHKFNQISWLAFQGTAQGLQSGKTDGLGFVIF